MLGVPRHEDSTVYQRACQLQGLRVPLGGTGRSHRPGPIWAGNRLEQDQPSLQAPSKASTLTAHRWETDVDPGATQLCVPKLGFHPGCSATLNSASGLCHSVDMQFLVGDAFTQGDLVHFLLLSQNA
jgi:hypothetical protein